ncbi:MAG: PilZ domain-containing protein [Kofleriaceae bacterium]|nr:PilZ domain-containing protein [Kofleriaceae bacterium]MCL4224490.1 PilZ domain-containing protein [Myxococcales bacterium]
MSRRANRIRARIAATVSPIAPIGDLFVCQTRDVSQVGCFLDTATTLEPGTRVAIAVFDPVRGSPVELLGEVTRALTGPRPGLGIRLLEPGDDWAMLVVQLARDAGPHDKPARRLRVLVVGDERRQRGALALYVTSGWDVQFATDLEGTVEALRGVGLDAVIAEHDATDDRWPPVMDEARRIQPDARRIVRGSRNGPVPEAPLVHRFVDRDAGLDALLDALTADRL